MEYPPKYSWSSPDKKWGWGVLGVLLTSLGIGAYFILPIVLTIFAGLVALVGKTIALAIMVGLLVGGVYVFTDPRVRRLISYKYLMIIQKIRHKLIESDPIGMLNAVLTRMRERQNQLQQQLADFQGHLKALRNEINRNRREMQENLKRADAFKRAGRDGDAVVAAQHATRLNNANKELAPMLRKMQLTYNMLHQMAEVARLKVANMENDIDVKTRQYKTMNAGAKALSAAKGIIGEDSEDNLTYEETVQHLLEKWAVEEARIEQFMDETSHMISDMEIQKLLDEEEGNRLLEAWRNNNLDLLSLTSLDDTVEGLKIDAVEEPKGAVPEFINTDFEKNINEDRAKTVGPKVSDRVK